MLCTEGFTFMTKSLQRFSSPQKDIFFHLWQSLLSVWLKTLILDILDTFSLQSKNGFILLKMTCFFYPSVQTNHQPNWKCPLKSKFEIQNPCRNQLQEHANLKQKKNKNWKTLLKTVMATEQWNLLVDNKLQKNVQCCYVSNPLC